MLAANTLIITTESSETPNTTQNGLLASSEFWRPAIILAIISVFVFFGARSDHFGSDHFSEHSGFSIFFSRASRAIILAGDHFGGDCV